METDSFVSGKEKMDCGRCVIGVQLFLSILYVLISCKAMTYIHLLFPLTKESVSTNNHNGQNYGGPAGIIETVNTFEEATKK